VFQFFGTALSPIVNALHALLNFFYRLLNGVAYFGQIDFGNYVEGIIRHPSLMYQTPFLIRAGNCYSGWELLVLLVSSVLSDFFFLVFFLLLGSVWSLVVCGVVPAGAAVVPEPVDAGAAEPPGVVAAGAVLAGVEPAGAVAAGFAGSAAAAAPGGFNRASGSLSSAVGSFTGATVTSVTPG